MSSHVVYVAVIKPDHKKFLSAVITLSDFYSDDDDSDIKLLLHNL